MEIKRQYQSEIGLILPFALCPIFVRRGELCSPAGVQRTPLRIGTVNLRRQIPHLIEHILHENAVSRGRVIDQHMGDSADELTVLNDWATRQ